MSINVKNYKNHNIENILASGSFGIVLKANRKTDSKVVCLKIIKKPNKTSKKNFRKEAYLTQLLNHRNLVKCNSFYDNRAVLYMELGYYGGGTLTQRMDSLKLGINDYKDIFKQMVAGVIELKKHRIVHLDLKPDNIIFEGECLKIVDLGISIILPTEDDSIVVDLCGTVPYMSPEIILGRPVSFAADWWAVAAILYQMLFDRFPFLGSPKELMMNAIATEAYGDQTEMLYFEETRAFFEAALCKDPDNRLHIENFMDDPFFTCKEDDDKVLESTTNAIQSDASKIIYVSSIVMVKKRTKINRSMNNESDLIHKEAPASPQTPSDYKFVSVSKNCEEPMPPQIPPDKEPQCRGPIQTFDEKLSQASPAKQSTTKPQTQQPPIPIYISSS